MLVSVVPTALAAQATFLVLSSAATQCFALAGGSRRLLYASWAKPVKPCLPLQYLAVVSLQGGVVSLLTAGIPPSKRARRTNPRSVSSGYWSLAKSLLLSPTGS